MPVHGEDGSERPAGGRLQRGAFDFGLRHAGIMFDFEGREGAALVTANSRRCRSSRTDDSATNRSRRVSESIIHTRYASEGQAIPEF